MTDRELLEAAAKTIGYEFNALWYDDQTGLLVWEPSIGNFERRDWNPLTDDGDALRLMVQMEIDICFGANYVIADGEQVPTVNNANDKCLAVRHAIVRAAAALRNQE